MSFFKSYFQIDSFDFIGQKVNFWHFKLNPQGIRNSPMCGVLEVEIFVNSGRRRTKNTVVNVSPGGLEGSEGRRSEGGAKGAKGLWCL